MAARAPVVGHVVPATKQPVPGAIPPTRQVSFSFKYFRQIDYFGLGSQEKAWFTSLLERLVEMSRETVAALNTDAGKRRVWRFHEINWNQTNIPIRLSDLTWLSRDVLENAKEYPLHQFQISMALGRVVGFFDNTVFNIVLFDPLHNIQPSKAFDYRVRETLVSESVAAAVMRQVESQLEMCKADGCVCRSAYAQFQELVIRNTEGKSVIVGLDKDKFDKVAGYIDRGIANSISDLLEIALGELEKLDA